MDNSGLLFIPDISGFTKFVNEIEVEHSRYIIGELLENIINSNRIGLTISEVEGDAVLFYRFGKIPSLEEIYGQVESMFCNFQKQLKNYESRRACQCSACVAAINLSLKVITHYGEFSTYNVNKYSKLIGKDVIVAHQLLKNNIDLHEYWLITTDLFSANQMASDLPAWINWQQGNKQTDKGNVAFKYSMLSQLKERVHPDPTTNFELGNNKIKAISKSRTIDASSISVLSVIGNFFLRPKWIDGVQSVGQASHPINHVGVKYHVVFNNRKMAFYASSFGQSNGTFYYSETDEKKTTGIYVTVKALTDNQTFLVIDCYMKKDFFMNLSFTLFMKNKLSRQLAKSLENLQLLCQQPGIGYTKPR
jgi:hypothetical protein